MTTTEDAQDAAERAAAMTAHSHSLERPTRRVFPGQADQAPLARRFVAQALRDCPAACDAELLANELVANALRHTATATGGTFTVAIQHAVSAVRITVTDDGAPTVPAIAHPVGLAPSGRGLALVDALAARWGHDAQGNGRSVWFELGCS